MTEEQINRAIAEACGWKQNENSWFHPNKGSYAKWAGGHPRPESEFLPNYCHDLNAMAEAERTLEDRDPADEYANALGEIAFGKDFDPFDHYCWPTVVKATARQRGEAFLRTIGKWTE